MTQKVATRSNVLEHLLISVLNAGDPNASYRRAFETAGISSIEELLELSKDDWKSLSWKDSSGDIHHLPLSRVNTLLSIGGWFASQSSTDESIFLSLTPIALADWRRAQASMAPSIGFADVPMTPSKGGATPFVAPRNKLSPADEFKKGIKRDITAFSKFSDRKQWNTWHRAFRATAKAQGLDNVLDATYVPSTSEEQALFDALQAYMFAAFTHTLKEPAATGVLRKYSGKTAVDEGNAQKLYQDLVALMSAGIAARTSRAMLEKEILELRLDHHWNKPIASFLTRLTHLIADLRELRDPSDTSSYNDVWCITTVDTCLSTHREMSSHVNSLASSRANIADMLAAQGTTVPAQTFDNYMIQLNNHAATLDSTKRLSRRNANNANRRGGGAGRGQGGRGGRNAGCGGSSGRGSAASGRGNGSLPSGDVTDPAVRLSDDQYAALTPEQRKARYERKQASRSVNATSTQPTVPPAVTVPAAAPASDSASVASGVPTPGSVLRHMMSTSAARPSDATQATAQSSSDVISINGVTYRRAFGTKLYRVNGSQSSPHPGSLVDGGANGGLLNPADVRVLETDLISSVDVVGVTDGVLESLPLVQAAARIETVSDGPIIGIFSQYALRSDGGRSIHSKGQLQHFGLLVDDTATAVGGTQTIVTNDGHVIPLHFRDGLAYMDMVPPSDDDMARYPHVFLTADVPWDPSVLDSEFPDDPDFPLSAAASARRESVDPGVHSDGLVDVSYALLAPLLYPTARFIFTAFITAASMLSAFPQQLRPRLPDLDMLRPHFAWLPTERIKSTLDMTTQFYRASARYPFRKHFKSRFPAANVFRLPEWFSTDTIFSDIPAHDDGIPGHGGCTMLQLYGGISSHFLAGFPMSSETDLPRTYQDFIRTHGAPLGLMSDNAKSETSTRMKDLHRYYLIKDRQSEPHHQHQNPIERRIQDVKKMTKATMDRVGCPGKFWLLCSLFIIGLLNVVTNPDGAIPLSVVTGEVADVSAYLSFHFWQEVLFQEPDNSERLGRWVGVASQGDALTYMILTNDTEQVVIRSNVRAAKDPMFPNRRARPDDGSPPSHGGEVNSKPVKLSSLSDTLGLDPSALELPKFSPEELLGLTFLHETDTGEKIRAKVTRQIMDRDAANHQNIKFLISLGDDDVEELIAYGELSDIIDRQHQAEANGELDTWTFSSIVEHEGPLTPHHSRYNGSSYNVKVRGSDGSETWEPLNIIAKDDPVTLAAYAKEHDLIETPGWKFLRRYTRRAKMLRRMLNQARRRSKNNGPRYKFGVQVPRNVKEALAFDKANGNTLWADSMALELGQLNDYKTFESAGKGRHRCPRDYQLIRCHMVFDVKEDGRRKSRFVAGGHMTEPPKESVYSSVASLRSVRMVCFLAELNGLELMTGDVGNAYLEAKTAERVAFIAGPEFGELEGHVMLIRKALYGLRTSGARFHEKFADTLDALGFKPSYADPDVKVERCRGCV